MAMFFGLIVCLTKKTFPNWEALWQLRVAMSCQSSQQDLRGNCWAGNLAKLFKRKCIQLSNDFSPLFFPFFLPGLQTLVWDSHLEDKGQEAWGQSHSLRKQKVMSLAGDGCSGPFSHLGLSNFELLLWIIQTPHWLNYWK